MQWDDLKVALALGEHSTVAGASRALGVTASTVNRRLAVLEDALGARLFDRLRSGVRPTEAGQRLLEHARTIQRQAAELELSVLDGDQRLEGPVTFTCPPTLLPFISSAIAAFLREHPAVEMIVRTTDQHADIAQREADVALRLTIRPPETLVGRRLCTASVGVYGHRDYLANAPVPHRLIAEDDGAPLPQWWSTGHVWTRANHLDWSLEAARQQLGLARLPCFIADPHPELQRMGEPLKGPQLGVWVLTHERLRSVARIRALVAALTAALTLRVDSFEGR